jgi:hypothetical protein
MNLHDFFLYQDRKKKRNYQKCSIPHFVGGSSQPRYPVTEEYARSSLLIYKPWKGTLKHPTQLDKSYIEEFEQFLQSEDCPDAVKIPYERMKQRYISKTQHYEPTSEVQGTDQPDGEVPQEIQDLVDLASSFNVNDMDIDEQDDLPYDFGDNYDWSKSHVDIEIDYSIIVSLLDTAMKDHPIFDETHKDDIGLPKKNDGSDYESANLRADQKDILAYLLNAVKKWTDKDKDFKPVRLIIKGVAGTGKSTLTNTFVSVLRKMFQDKGAVWVFAPTGAAAFNAGGSTVHRHYSIPINFDKSHIPPMKAKKMKELLTVFKNTVALVLDERSLLSAHILTVMEAYTRSTMHGGHKENQDWGGIPIVILIGDDYQLPAVEKPASNAGLNRPCNGHLEECGYRLFLDFAQNVMELKETKRQHPSQQRLANILKSVRAENIHTTLSQEDASFLCSYNLSKMKQMNDPPLTTQQIKFIEDNSTYIMANKLPVANMNKYKLFTTHSSTNPVARIYPTTMSRGRKIRNTKHYENDRALTYLDICRNSTVQLSALNLRPEWGLYRGSMGVVKDIVYKNNEGPHLRELPLYVLVEFLKYTGPELIPGHPKLVPITPRTIFCRYMCCQQTLLPLTLAYARTIHSFQGCNAGPSQPGQQQNDVQRIIVDPGTKQFEGHNPGLFYTALSRITTMGDPADKSTSAIFFTGSNMTSSRIMNITKGSHNKFFKTVLKRDKWVRRFHLHSSSLSIDDQQTLFNWAENTTFDQNQIQHFIH